MSRTVTGTYTLRPTSYSSYRSSGAFTDWFSNNNAPSNWTNNMPVGTNIGDGSDSTYYNDTSVSTSTNAKNCIMNLTVTSGTVPEFEYDITKVTFYYRNKTSNSVNSSRIFRIWNTIYDFGTGGTPKALLNNGHFCNMGFNGSNTGSTSITTRSSEYSSFTNTRIAANDYPSKMALCTQAYKTSHLTSYNSYTLYDVWYVIEYSYVENETTVRYFDDDGVSVTANGSALTSESTYQDYYKTAYPLVATLAPGHVFDGWYLNGVKVSSSLSYTYVFPKTGVDWLYCITKYRKIFVGTYQVDEIYIGTSPVGDIYDGNTKIWGNSPLYGDATSVG